MPLHGESNSGGLVSVIVPVYGTAEYLGKCLQSVFRQTHTEIAVWAVDDGSTDDAARLLAESALADARVMIVSQGNAGLSAARNNGIALTGRNAWGVLFLDSDDWLADDAVELLADCVREHRADLACGFRLYLSPDGKILDRTWRERFEHESAISREEMFSIQARTLASQYTYVTGKLYRREVVEGFRFPVGKFYEDSFCHRLYGRCGRIAFTNQTVYNYLIRFGSIANSPCDIRNLDKVEMLADRVGYFRDEGFGECSARCLAQACRLLVATAINISNVDKAVRQRVLELRRMLWAEYRKSSLEVLPLLERLRCFVSLRFFWPLYHFRRWQIWFRRR